MVPRISPRRQRRKNRMHERARRRSTIPPTFPHERSNPRAFHEHMMGLRDQAALELLGQKLSERKKRNIRKNLARPWIWCPTIETFLQHHAGSILAAEWKRVAASREKTFHTAREREQLKSARQLVERLAQPEEVSMEYTYAQGRDTIIVLVGRHASAAGVMNALKRFLTDSREAEHRRWQRLGERGKRTT